MKFWNIDAEIRFFSEALKNFASPEQLFYKLKEEYFAYIPKDINAQGKTLQSRISLIGQYTEKWCKDFFQPIANTLGLYAINGVICPELGLSKRSNADLAFCKTNNRVQSAKNIKLIFEIKMSIVNNYKYTNNRIEFIGDYKTHKGNPSILRSDSMLKAIGKSINIRVSDGQANKIPIIILGNTPISKNYLKKVDYLKKAGIIQSFISLYPNPMKDFIKNSKERGFQTFDNYHGLSKFISDLVNSDLHFFSSMLSQRKLGEIITISSKEKDDILKAEKFLRLLNE